MTAEKASSTTFKCSHCKKEFKYDSERKRHEISHAPCFECETCGKKFSFISALRRHQKQHERTGSVKCEECGGKFRDESLLKRHVNYAHKGTYICTKCNASFSSEPALRTHAKTHKPQSDRKYKCKFDSCGKTFNFSHHLKHHELTHTNGKQHYCNACGKGFIQYHHLKTHLKTHDPEKFLYCEVSNCRKKFATEYARKRHIATHKRKLDGGISSDTNLKNEDLVSDILLCASCGEWILEKQYETHKSICLTSPELAEISFFEEDMNEVLNSKPNVDDEISNCKTALGACMTEESDSKCLCAQISRPLGKYYNFTPIENINESLSLTNICEGCKCAGNCNSYEKRSANGGCSKSIKHNTKTIDIMPEIIYRNDGTVKIKDTFDMDIENIENHKVEKWNPLMNEIKTSFNSCKDVLGNCIVSGDSTMGEGCLCARMILDDQQLMAQEIDDITPHPKTGHY